MLQRFRPLHDDNGDLEGDIASGSDEVLHLQDANTSEVPCLNHQHDMHQLIGASSSLPGSAQEDVFSPDAEPHARPCRLGRPRSSKAARPANRHAQV